MFMLLLLTNAEIVCISLIFLMLIRHKIILFWLSIFLFNSVLFSVFVSRQTKRFFREEIIFSDCCQIVTKNVFRSLEQVCFL